MNNKIKNIITAGKRLVQDDISLNPKKAILGNYNIDALNQLSYAFDKIKKLNKWKNDQSVEVNLFIKSTYDLLKLNSYEPKVKSKIEGNICFMVPAISSPLFINSSEKEMNEEIETAQNKREKDSKRLETLGLRINKLQNTELEDVLKNNISSFISNKNINGRKKLREDIISIHKDLESFFNNMVRTDEGREYDSFPKLINSGFAQYYPSNIPHIDSKCITYDKNAIRDNLKECLESLEKGNVLNR